MGQSDDGQVLLAGYGEDLVQQRVLALGVNHPAQHGDGRHAGLMSQIHGRLGESGAPQDAALGRPDGPDHARPGKVSGAVVGIGQRPYGG